MCHWMLYTNAWHISSRLDKKYYITDLITDILSGGGSSRLYHSLVKEKKLFSNIECYHFGSIDEWIACHRRQIGERH